MNKDELNALIEKCADPDKGLESLTVLKEAVNEMIDAAAIKEDEYNKATEKIQELRDTNMRLFLKIGSPSQKADEKTESDELKEKFDKMFS